MQPWGTIYAIRNKLEFTQSLSPGAAYLTRNRRMLAHLLFCRGLHASRNCPSTSVEMPLQINPFYAKQTQFPKGQNERKYLLYKGLSNFYPAGGAKKQTQFKPNLRKSFYDKNSVRGIGQLVVFIGVEVRSDTLCHLSYIAVVLGRQLRWDPVQERVVGDDRANQLLATRSMRSPWHL